MQCVEIDQNLVGCAVEIDLKSGKLEGKVRSVDSTGSKVTIIEGFLLPSKTPLPPIYRVFIKDILKGKSTSIPFIFYNFINVNCFCLFC